MIDELISESVITMDKTYDYIFIGSGIAAATTASYLLKNAPETSILILEAGNNFLMKDRRKWWDYITTGKRPYLCAQDQTEDQKTENSTWGFIESRLMLRGGSTVHWGGWSLRLKPEDFQVQKNTGRGCNWPFGYEELKPYYKEAESYLSVSGESIDNEHYPQPAFPYVASDGPMIRAFEQLGMEYQPMPIARYRKCMTTGTCKYCPFGSRYAASYTLDELEKYPNVKIITGATVSELQVSSKNKIDGVVLKESKDQLIKGNNYIIAAGAYESPKLLIRSINKNFWPKGIGNDYDLVGRHLVSHRLLEVSGYLPKNSQHWQQALDFPTLMSRHYDTIKEQEHGKLFLFKSRSNPKTDISGMMRNGKSHSDIIASVNGKMKMKLQGFMEDFGRFDNRIEIGEKFNQFGLPQNKVTFVHQQDFEKRAYKNMQLMARVLQKMGCSDIKTEILDSRGDHASGTCRMHKEPIMGVVDANLKVHGVNNLYVCSNATFPSTGAVNPTLTLTALAIRLANYLSSVK